MSSSHGTTRTAGLTRNDYKAIDDSTTAFDAVSASITDGTNSYDRWLYGVFTGSFTNLSGGLFAHTATALGTGLVLKGAPASTTTTLAYAQPSQTANTNLTVTMTSPVAITSGRAVSFAGTGPENNTGRLATYTSGPTAYTDYLTTQLLVSGAAAGPTAEITLTLRYDES